MRDSGPESHCNSACHAELQINGVANSIDLALTGLKPRLTNVAFKATLSHDTNVVCTMRNRIGVALSKLPEESEPLGTLAELDFRQACSPQIMAFSIESRQLLILHWLQERQVCQIDSVSLRISSEQTALHSALFPMDRARFFFHGTPHFHPICSSPSPSVLFGPIY